MHSLLKIRTLENFRAYAVIFSTMALALFGLGVSTLACMAQTCPVNTPHIQGVWRTLPYLMPINPISATLLHTGKVLSSPVQRTMLRTIPKDRRATETPFGIQRIRLQTESRSRKSNTTSSAAARLLYPTVGLSSSEEHRIIHSRATTARRFSIQLRMSSRSLKTW